MMEGFLKVIQNYANFNGRARRKEYWMFLAVFSIIAFAIMAVGVLGTVMFDAPEFSDISIALIYLFYFALLIPSLAVQTRRLHDTGKSGWLQLLGFIPFGGLVLLVFYLTAGDRGSNKYGPDPKEDEQLTIV